MGSPPKPLLKAVSESSRRVLGTGYRMHREGLSQHPRSGVNVDQRVIHRAAADDSGNVSAEVGRLMDHKSISEQRVAVPGARRRGCRRCALRCCNAGHQQQNGDSHARGGPMGHYARRCARWSAEKAFVFGHLKPHSKETVANVVPMCLGGYSSLPGLVRAARSGGTAWHRGRYLINATFRLEP